MAWQHWPQAVVGMLLQQLALSPHCLYHALKRASYAGQQCIVEAVLADPRLDAVLSGPASPYSSPRTAIVWAVEGGQLDILQSLLADGRVDPAIGEALPIAVDSGRGDIVRCLLADPRVWHAAQIARWLKEAVPAAARANDAGMLQDLMSHPAVDAAEAVPAAVISAAMSGAAATLDWLLVNTHDAARPRARQRALQAAAAGGHLAVVERLLSDPTVDPSALNNAAIQDAADSGHTAIVACLMADPRVDASDCGNAALQRALEGRYIDCAAQLLRDERVRTKWLRGPAGVPAAAGATASAAVGAPLSAGASAASASAEVEGTSLDAALCRLRSWGQRQLSEAAAPTPDVGRSLAAVHSLLRWSALGLTAREWEEHIVKASQSGSSTDVLFALLNSQFASQGDILRAAAAAATRSVARCAAVLSAMLQRPPRCIEPGRGAEAGVFKAATSSAVEQPSVSDSGAAPAGASSLEGGDACRRRALSALLLTHAGLSRSCMLALLRTAARLGLADIVQQVLEHPALGELGAEGDISVQHAAREGHLAVLDLLLSDG